MMMSEGAARLCMLIGAVALGAGIVTLFRWHWLAGSIVIGCIAYVFVYAIATAEDDPYDRRDSDVQ